MQFIESEILAGELVPVLLGQSVETNETAKRIFRRYRLISHVFCEKKPRVFGLTFCTKFHIIQAVGECRCDLLPHSLHGRLREFRLALP